jgi:uncharacterized protein YutE (UPF0331/DUF86 family)
VATEDLDPLPPTVQELLREDDPFRLVIRAHAEIEQLIAMATQSVFVEGKMPEELRHLGFIRKLSLAISLGLVPPEAMELIKQLTELRNELAHGRGAAELSRARARQILRPCRPHLPEEIKQRLKDEPPITYLRLAAAVIYLQFADAISVAVAERDFAEKAVAEARAKGVLSAEQIRELLAEEEDENELP